MQLRQKTKLVVLFEVVGRVPFRHLRHQSTAAQQNRKCRDMRGKQHHQQEESTIEIIIKDDTTNQEVNTTIIHKLFQKT